MNKEDIKSFFLILNRAGTTEISLIFEDTLIIISLLFFIPACLAIKTIVKRIR